MLAAALLLIAAPHCADASFCPTLPELRQAVSRHYDREEVAMLRKHDPGPDTNMTIRRPQVLRITGVYCGQPDDDGTSLTCRMTYHHRTGRADITARLSRTADGWQVEQLLDVWREN